MHDLKISNMSFSYGTAVIFNSVSMTVEPYSITGILGGNGAGKTTLFDLMCRLQHPGSGMIESEAKHTLYLSQILTIPPVLTMRDVAKMTVALSAPHSEGISDILDTIAAWDALLFERYSKLLERKSSLCSYGEKRWFFTLTLLALNPEVLILDEPTAGVDPENRYYIWSVLRSAASRGAAIVISSHNTHEIIEKCDQFYMISQCKLRRFQSDEQYMKYYEAQTLDEAFITAVGT